jgi:hypothetical protein
MEYWQKQNKAITQLIQFYKKAHFILLITQWPLAVIYNSFVAEKWLISKFVIFYRRCLKFMI